MADRTEDETPPSLRHTERTTNASTPATRSGFSSLSRSLSALRRSLRSTCLSLLAHVTPSATTALPTESAPATSEAMSSRPTDPNRADIASEADSEATGTYIPDIDPNHPLLGVDPQLLNPERRILQLLLSEGGALPQSELVERTRWSASTISRALCRMETQERVERYRRGSGNLVVVPQNREN